MVAEETTYEKALIQWGKINEANYVKPWMPL